MIRARLQIVIYRHNDGCIHFVFVFSSLMSYDCFSKTLKCFNLKTVFSFFFGLSGCLVNLSIVEYLRYYSSIEYVYSWVISPGGVLCKCVLYILFLF